MRIEMHFSMRIGASLYKVLLQNDDYPAGYIWSELVNTFSAVYCLPISHGSAVNKPSGVKMISFEQMKCYPEDPELRVLLDLDEELEPFLEPQADAAPLDIRVAELQDALVPAGDIADLQGMARVLGLEAVPVLKCAVLRNDELGRYCSIDDCKGLDRVVDYHFLALSEASVNRVLGLSPADLFLHEAMHIHFHDHDWAFATALNWARLRCRMPLLADPYDVRAHCRLGANGEQLVDLGVLAFAHRLATSLADGEWEFCDVVQTLLYCMRHAHQCDPEKMAQLVLSVVPQQVKAMREQTTGLS